MKNDPDKNDLKAKETLCGEILAQARAEGAETLRRAAAEAADILKRAEVDALKGRGRVLEAAGAEAALGVHRPLGLRTQVVAERLDDARPLVARRGRHRVRVGGVRPGRQTRSARRRPGQRRGNEW